MDDFQWTGEPSQEELVALARYKDDAWIELNQQLRTGTLTEENRMLLELLDSVVLKGRSTCSLTLFRAVPESSAQFSVGAIVSDSAFLSTTTAESAITEFYEAVQPAKLVIEVPNGTAMARFRSDSGCGEERERLLPRRARFTVTAVERITDLQQILREQCTTGRPWLTERSTLLKVFMQPIV